VTNPNTIPLGLYVHLPWCIRKCPYCDFNSHEAREAPFEPYVDALLADFRAETATGDVRVLDTIFIGGGTPSLFPAPAIARLLDGIRALKKCADDIEVTLEANPGAADADRFSGYLEAGVNRISIGVQSFDDARLAAIGRVHGAADARAAISAARDAGCRRINVDLMHGLPGGRAGDAIADLTAAITFEPEHISWYQLTLEPGTAFAHKPPRLPDEDLIAADTEAGTALLEAAGYDRYEVSAYARPGERARHNMNYWQFGDYIGIGAGAHGKTTRTAGIFRRVKRRSPVAYMAHAGTADATEETGPATADDVVAEFALNALRLRHGYHETLFAERTDLSASVLEERYREAVRRGWMERENGHVRPTALGFRFLNDLQVLFFV